MSEFGLQQNLGLSQTLSPQMQQSLQYLQASALELQTLVRQELEQNPVLEETPPEEPAADDEWDQEVRELQRHDEEWRDYFSQHQPSRAASGEAARRRDHWMESQVRAETLADHLTAQLHLATDDPHLRRAAAEIIGNLGGDGLLPLPLGEIAAATGLPLEAAERALALVQSFHPPGIAARNLGECLRLQLEHLGQGASLEARIVVEDLALLSRKRYAEIARRHKASPERVAAAAQAIARLNPRPAAAFTADAPQDVVFPEAVFEPSGTANAWKPVLQDEPLPRLHISSRYKELLGTATRDPGLRDYLRERIRAGKFLIKCLHQRQQTLESILNEIAARQQDFFNLGPSALKPMTMAQVAQAVGVHETTVSRAAANKHVRTPWGVLPLKYFFTSGYRTDQGERMANTSVKDAIAELVARETKSKPLSDSEIVGILGERGVRLARRTVAKYRDELNILPSNLRRTP